MPLIPPNAPRINASQMIEQQPNKNTVFEKIQQFFNKLFHGEISDALDILFNKEIPQAHHHKAMISIISKADPDTIDKIQVGERSYIARNSSANVNDRGAMNDIVMVIDKRVIYEQSQLGTPPTEFENFITHNLRYYFPGNNGTLSNVASNAVLDTDSLKALLTANASGYQYGSTDDFQQQIDSIEEFKLEIHHGNDRSFGHLTLDMNDGYSISQFLTFSGSHIGLVLTDRSER